jgi:hypothetical protein
VNNFIVPKRGSNIGGLVKYLFGPGDANEHRDQRIIAADDLLDIADCTRLDRPEDRPQVLALGRDLDAHRRLLGVRPPGGHVWHCAISLPPGEALSDMQWAQLARVAVAEMGFTAGPGQAPCRWLAVHHGQSTGGNEHIHLAVNLVREDGSIASTWRDRVTMSRICGRFEREFGLHVVEGRAGRGMPGYSRAEADRVRRRTRLEPDRRTLARTVRACAAASASEAEFVRRIRAAGLQFRPRYAAGGTEVTGYSVALGSTDIGGEPIRFGGGRLATDLTLPRLREHWAAMRPGVDQAAAREQALAELRHLTDAASPAGQPTPAETRVYRASAWGQAAARIAEVRERLTAVPYGDTAAWSTAARQAAGIFAGLSARLESTPGPLAEAADALARSAQTRPGQERYARHSGLAHMRSVALTVRQATIPLRRPEAWVTLMRQLLTLIQVISQMHAAQQQARHAAELRAIANDRLAALGSLPSPAIRTAPRLVRTDFPGPAKPAPAQPGPTPPQPAGPERDVPSKGIRP